MDRKQPRGLQTQVADSTEGLQTGTDEGRCVMRAMGMMENDGGICEWQISETSGYHHFPS